ncbi:hypothetical protein GCM10022259_27500 [Aquimarina mytili]
MGISLGVAKVKNFRMTEKSKSLPANSDINSHIVCNKRINIIIIKSGKNVFKNVVKIYLSRIFTSFVFPNYLILDMFTKNQRTRIF